MLLYTLLIAFLMVSTIPTYSGKLMGERISREYVLPIFMLAVGFVALLVTYPFGTLTGASIFYLALVPFSWRRYVIRAAASKPAEAPPGMPAAQGDVATRDGRRIVAIRPKDQSR